MRRRLTFSAGCVFEAALLVLGLVLGRLAGRPALANLCWNWESIAIGIVASLPPLLFFLWTLRSDLRVCSRHKEWMESLLRPLFGNWSILQFAMISVVAGMAEETFFRGALQGNLAARVGNGAALVLAALAFGAAHLITWTYAIIAAAIGAYLGLLLIWTGNLLTPMITHAVYDFVALVYFVRIHRSR